MVPPPDTDHERHGVRGAERAGYAAVILAGGAGRRLGGPAKPTLPVGGRPMLDRVLAAVVDAVPRVVVGPPSLAVPAGVLRISEEPPGGGPVAALAAGLARLDRPARKPAPPESAPAPEIAPALETAPAPGVAPAPKQAPVAEPAPVAGTVAVLAADLPFLTRPAVAVLRHALAPSTVDGVVFVDRDGRRQTLCGIWRVEALRCALAGLDRHHGAALRDLLAGLRVREISSSAAGPPPWYDCDTPEDLDRAEGWR